MMSYFCPVTVFSEPWKTLTSAQELVNKADTCTDFSSAGISQIAVG